MRKGLVIAALVAVVAVALHFFLPHLKARGITEGTPVPQPLYQLTDFTVPPRASACLDQVAVEPGLQYAAFTVDTPGAWSPLRFTLQAGSFKQERDVPAGAGPTNLNVPFAGPPIPALGVVCIRNLGQVPVSLRGTNETRTLSRPRLTIGGKPATGEVSLAFSSADIKSRTDFVATMARRISAFRPVWVQPIVVVVLLVVVFVGAFVVPLLALWRSFALDERQDLPDDG
jgi:hypothetical protein